MDDAIAITGANGFVGQNFQQFLQKNGRRFYAVIRRPDGVNKSAIGFGSLDTKYMDEAGTTAVVHLAGKAHDIANVAEPEEYYQVNFGLTKKVYDEFLRSRAGTFIFLSSVKAVKDTVEGILTEEDDADPLTVYGKSKLLAENYLLDNLPAGKRLFILRPCMIHGPGNKGNLNLLYKVVKSGLPYPLAAFENRRSYLSVGNLCFVIEELLKREDISSGIYNVADDIPLPTNRVVEIIAQVLSQKKRLWHVNRKLVRVIAGIGDMIRLPLSSDRLKKLTESYVVDNRKLIAALGKELPLNAEEGLRITIQSFVNDK